MSISLRNKIITLFVVIALAVTTVLGVSTLSNSIAVDAEEAKVYYVSPTAAVGTVGEAGNPDKPYNINLLLNSASILKPGDTVKVLPGDYDLVPRITIVVSGAYNNYITIENASDTEQATLRFYGQDFSSLNRGVTISGDYIHWRDIDVCGAGDNGLYIGGSYNIVEDCEFYDNRDSGLQLGRSSGDYNLIEQWPSYNLIKNCTSHNNYDNQTYGENADGFAAKLTIGYGNVFDGCISYRNSDDGWDLYAKVDSGNIGAVIMYNCVAFENGYLEYSQAECNAKFPTYSSSYDEANTASYDTRDGDGNGFKLGGSVMEGDVVMYNCLSFNNKYHGVTDNSNPGVISLTGVTSYDNNRSVDANGNIVTQSSSLGGGNIDLARQTYSYNNMEGVLSVKSSKVSSVSDDAYRASVQNSYLRMGSNGYMIEGAMDLDTKQGLNGKKTAAPSESVFAKLPIDYDTATYNLTGLRDFDNGENRIHVKYRNSDGSVNLGEILAVQTQPIQGVSMGAVLNKASYEEYEHFALDLNFAECTSETQAILQAAADTLTIAANQKAVYQDFWVPANMKNVEITWSSSDESVLTVEPKEKEIASASKTAFEYVTVMRGEEDAGVTLTATVSADGESVTRSFDLVVKKDEPRIGDIYVMADGVKIYSGDSFIITHYLVATEPEITVVNGANYSGSQFVKGSQYTDEVTYEYAASRLDKFVEVREFTPGNAGVWHITHKVVLNSSNETQTYDYYIYVASPAADVDFTNPAKLSVNLEGYMIEGNLSNVTGYIYALSSEEELDVTAENIKDMEGVEYYTYTSDYINLQFTNANQGGYHVYYALANMRGEITSEVYHDQVTMMEVNSREAFMKVAGGQKLADEEISKTIYNLTACLDFTGVTWNSGSDAFTGYLLGNGHTIKNVTINGKTGLFNKVEGGTISGVNFDNIVIDSASSQRVGIVSSMYGGTLDSISITNIKTIGSQRVGTLVGQVFEASVPTNIQSVSVVNPVPEINADGSLVDADTAYYVKANGTRASGLVGYIQPSSAPTEDTLVYIRDCYTQVYAWSTSYSIGGIVGEFDDSKGATTDLVFVLEIKNCYTASILVGTGSSSRIGGMVGYHRGGGSLVINGCLSLMKAYYANLPVDASQKNISPIMGNFASSGERISQCASLMDEYNTDYGVTAYSESMFSSRFGLSILRDTIGFSTDTWEFVYADDGTTLTAPYLKVIVTSCGC